MEKVRYYFEISWLRRRAESFACSTTGRRHSSKRRKGVQVDLLIQSRRTNYVIEIKRENEIDRSIIDEVDEKVANLKRPKNVSVKTALVYAGELAPIVEADGYFDALVPIEKLLGLPANP